MPRISHLKNFFLRLLDLIHFPDGNMPQTKDGMIRKAFDEKRLLELVYSGYRRVVEPHVYGMKNEKDGMMTYQVRGESSSGVLGWKRMHLEKTMKIRVLRETFPGKRPSLDQHSKWDKIYRIID